MRVYRFLRLSHKWVGIVLALEILLVAGTGLLLLVKKQSAWIQPPTREGAPGEVADLITLQELLAVTLAQQHLDFRTVDDIQRIDFRPGMRVFKVSSWHNYSEMQIDAVGGAVLSTAVRRSDLLENLHDGSWLGSWYHGGTMLVLAAGLVFLTVSGLWIWLQPALRRRAHTG